MRFIVQFYTVSFSPLELKTLSTVESFVTAENGITVYVCEYTFLSVFIKRNRYGAVGTRCLLVVVSEGLRARPDYYFFMKKLITENSRFFVASTSPRPD